VFPVSFKEQQPYHQSYSLANHDTGSNSYGHDGLFSAVMIGLGRAVGETMIVLMATGNTPVMEMEYF
jgi:hypothetical protein